MQHLDKTSHIVTSNTMHTTSPYKIASNRIYSGYPMTIRLSDRNYSSMQGTQKETFKKFYELPNITLLRFLSRLKLYQTAAAFILVPVNGYFFSQGIITLANLQTSIAIATTASLLLYLMSFKVFQRVVGMLSFNENQDTVKISHLDFFGGRKDIYVPLEEIYPLSELPDDPKDVYVKLIQDGAKQPFYLSIRYGHVIDVKQFRKVLGSRSV